MIQKKFLTAAIIAASLSLEALPVNAGVLGGINLQTACNKQVAFNLVDPVLVGSNPNAYSWRCRGYALALFKIWPWWDFSVDMTRACRYQYGSTAFAETTDWRNPYSWRCRN
jgi:hypothetical protein